MPEQAQQDKTEQATPKKVLDSRMEGKAAQSQEFSSAAVLFFGVLFLSWFGPRLVGGLKYMFTAILGNLSDYELTQANFYHYFGSGSLYFAKLLAPFVLLIGFIAVLSKVLQVGLMWTLKPMKPDFKKMSPIKGVQRIFSSRGVVEMLKGVMKILIVGFIGYFTLKAEIPAFLLLTDQDITATVAAITSISLKMAMRAAIAILILAIFDFVYQKWKHNKEIMMTKQEVKEETKQTEGDPLIKAKIRDIQLKMSFNRMLKSVPDADVVVVNPVHVSVALKYNGLTDAAPKVVAKGQRKLAAKIKEIAMENDVPIVEQPELARALFRATEVGWEIPEEFFQAVAEVLALVYRMREKMVA